MKTKKRGLIIGAVVTAFAIVGTSFALWATTLSGNGAFQPPEVGRLNSQMQI